MSIVFFPACKAVLVVRETCSGCKRGLVGVVWKPRPVEITPKLRVLVDGKGVNAWIVVDNATRRRKDTRKAVLDLNIMVQEDYKKITTCTVGCWSQMCITQSASQKREHETDESEELTCLVCLTKGVVIHGGVIPFSPSC